jgi:MFS family permease
MIAELDFNQTRFGLVFSVFVLLYSIVGPAVGWGQRKIGIRRVMILGALSTALGLVVMSRATTLWHCVLGYSLLGGGGIGFTTIIPCQTLAQNWFNKRKALAIAIIFSSGGIIGKFWPPVVGNILDAYGWRATWLIIAAISIAVAILVAIFVRERPEDLGQFRDGIDPGSRPDDLSIKDASETDRWTARDAMRTWQFVVLVICGVAYATPWGVAVGFSRLHFAEVGLERETIFALVGTMSLVSIIGRFSGALGDLASPSKLLALSLIVEGVGMGMMLYADDAATARIAVILIGLGFGTAYISIPVVFAGYFGRNAFGMTAGVRIFITGIFNGLGPVATGFAHDSTGSYAIPFLGLAVFTVIAGLAAAGLRKPPVPLVQEEPFEHTAP